MPDNFIAHDNIIDVLIKFPVRSLLRFKVVCKSWRSLIDDRQFINLHQERCKSDITNYQNQKIFLSCFGMVTEQIYHYSLDAPSLQRDSVVSLLKPPTIPESSWSGKVYVNSCNGLFVLALSPYNIVLWNPTIRESRNIPSPISIHGEQQSHTFYGLGYDSPSSKDDYKIVRLGLIYHPDGHDVQIFSTKSDSWKLIGKLPVSYDIEGDMVVADGIVYMIINEPPDNKFILSLCLKNENLEEILFQGRRDLIMEKPNLFTVEGCLSLTKYSSLINELADFEVWRMKKNGTMSYSWSKVLAITVPVPDDNWLCTRIHVLPVSFMKDGGMLFRRSKAELVIYDPKTQKFEEVKIAGLEASLYLYGAVTYVETLISPNAF